MPHFDMRGLYLHIPFCDRKCAYCDFYSFSALDKQKSEYADALLDRLKKTKRADFDTLYIGGGTPSVLESEKLGKIVSAGVNLLDCPSEITVEANPQRNMAEITKTLAKAGVNRMSFGLQSANENELKILSRNHTAEDVKEAVNFAKKSGIDNITVDLMLGIPEQTKESLDKSIDFALSLGVKHISCYILKIEENTVFAKKTPLLPDDDRVGEMYLHTVEQLKENGFCQYEISNFAIPGFESKHNLHYWNDDEYLGLGPSAHSFMNGKRFYYPRDIKAFIEGTDTVFDCDGGDFTEYAMLRLRLSDGIKKTDCKARFENGEKLFENLVKRAKKYEKNGLVSANDDCLSLTPEGFLLSNAILSEIL